MGGVTYSMYNNKQLQLFKWQIKTTHIIVASFRDKPPNLIPANISDYMVHVHVPVTTGEVLYWYE